MISVGIIGFGRIGAEHAKWIAGTTRLRVASIADATPARRALAQGRDLVAHDSADRVLDDASIHAVLVSIPTAMHFDLASRALRAGKHVMIEKPMAMDFAQAMDLVNLANRQGRVLSVFHNRRWDADFLTIRAAIAAGVLGRVFNIESRLGQWSSCVGPAALEYRPGWRNEAAYGGGGLYDWGSHFIDQLLQMMLAAQPTRVFAQLQGNMWTRDCDDFARVLIDFDDGTSGLVEINTTTTRPLPRWHVDGALGSVSSPYRLDFDTEKWADFTFSRADGSSDEKLSRVGPGFTESQIWEQFARAIGGECEPAVTAQSVLPTMRVLDAARMSAREGRAVDVTS